MITPEAVADLHDAAAAHIETYGWTQGEFYTGPVYAPAEKCKVCARGGIAVAAGAAPEFGEVPLECAKLPLIFDDDDPYCGHLAPEDQARLELIEAAEKAFAAHLRNTVSDIVKGPVDEAVITRWNDAEDRTAEQVIAALRECAADFRKAGPA